MKLKNTLLASALISATAFSVNAATELTPEQAAALKPYDRIVVTGRFNAIGDAVAAVSRRADKDGAASFMLLILQILAAAVTGALLPTSIKLTLKKRKRQKTVSLTALWNCLKIRPF
jgi:hypothetical protein